MTRRFISIPDHVEPNIPDEKWAFGGLEFTDSFNWSGSSVGNGRIRFNVSAGLFEFSENGGAWTSVPAGHSALRQLIHFIDNGPAQGFATGAYRETTGTIYPTSIIWYNHGGPGKIKIVEKLITWAGVLPATITWNMYDAAGVVIATISDAISYSGMFETSRTRTIS